ncbi:alanine/glycine:cation symporter family protein [Entomospira nematocerorum]|uniref:Alanine:cation symporter family protein n=1 Tax=Entomospira nematocerorum TaxID=2719987 RepID=A0A968GCG6_9SPIO|nr:alanine/glycine:cation symporter family protein [Entomospira nematocera]NIZ46542.1 alanine:cation symporter family protein [Entomospira nematocera]WDI33659.1 alanine/glycine:cation symporter family protein [Entomospira nematocera]
MSSITNDIAILVENLWKFLAIPVILGLGLYFSIFTGFVQIRYFSRVISMLKEGFHHKDSDGNKREGVSSFQAFAISIASRVGTGNLAGVAVAIAWGGPGAIFWMWVMAFLGMATAFVESTLAQVYKVPANEPGHFRGGPSFYLSNALKSRPMAIIFSVLMMITFGYIFNMIQVNTIANSFLATFDISIQYTGIFLAILAGLILMGGISRIAKMSSAFVPVMAISYVLLGLVVIFMNYKSIPYVFQMIVTQAFTGNAATGGVVGLTIMHGLRRGLFSNEAGMGTAPAAAAAANTSHPVKQGLIQSFSVFTDTFVVCSITAFIILTSGVPIHPEAEGIILTQQALATSLGSASNYYLSIIIFVFAFTSVIGNYFYAETSLAYISGDNRIANTIFKVTVVIMLYIGVIAKSEFVWNLADLFSALMALVNLYAITRLFPILRLVLKDFSEQMKKGKDPVFYAENIGSPENIVCWDKDGQV